MGMLLHRHKEYTDAFKREPEPVDETSAAEQEKREPADSKTKRAKKTEDTKPDVQE